MSLLVIALLILYTVALAIWHARQRQGESLLADVVWTVITLGL